MNPVTTKSVVVKFKLKDVFPSDNKMSVPLLRLMAATNDVRHLQKLILLQFAQEPTNQAEGLVREGELGYFLRMLCGHLHEAGIAFRNLDSEYKKQVDTVIANDEEAKKLLRQLRDIYNDSSEQGLRKALESIRNVGAFHYQSQEFTDALERHESDGKLVPAEFAGMSRYTLADDLSKQIMLKTVARSVEKFQEMVGSAIALAGILGQAIDHLLLALFEKHEQAILEQTTETSNVPTALSNQRALLRKYIGETMIDRNTILYLAAAVLAAWLISPYTTYLMCRLAGGETHACQVWTFAKNIAR